MKFKPGDKILILNDMAFVNGIYTFEKYRENDDNYVSVLEDQNWYANIENVKGASKLIIKLYGKNN